ncbi:MAG TPA: TonB-dependent receptor [Steroidobacteraceae bacterium]|nr:TonB-dependent receptor [Steroidobacteraceae bacterium]
MKKKNLAMLMTAVPIAATSFSPAAFAQDTFEPIIVTAQKREQSIYDVPVAISAFNADTIERQGITDLVDIGKFVPNLNVTGFSAGHTSSANPFIRGIGLQDHLITTDPGVGVYVDGVYLGRQVGQNWNLTNIERVEVLRGPQGTLYGRNSIGGAINIITRKPGDEEGGRVSLTAGSRGRLNGDAYTNFRLSEQFAMSLGVAYQSRDGVGEFLNVVNPSREVGEMQDTSGRIAMLWEPSDRLSFLLTADGNDGDNGLRPYDTLVDELGAACRAAPPPGGCAGGFPGNPFDNGANGFLYNSGFRNSDGAADPYDNNTAQSDQVKVTNKAYGVSLTVDYEISDGMNIRLLASDRHSEYESGLDDDGFLVNSETYPEVGEADQKSIELQLTGKNGALDYVLGLYHFEEEGGNFQSNTRFHNGNNGDFLLLQDVDSDAIYANVGYAVSDRLRIAAGVRHTQDDKSAIAAMVLTGVWDFAVPDSHDWSETSWDISASFKMNDRMTFYGTVQSGYQSGQYQARPYCLIGEFFGSGGNIPPVNCFSDHPALDNNVTALNYEVGLKGQPLSNLEMSIAVFYTDYTDLPYQVSSTTGAGFSTESIIVDQTSQGIEWESAWAVTDNFRLYTTLGYIDANVKDDNPFAVAPLTPELTASISPELTVPMGNGELTLRADWSHRDDMFGEPSSDPGRFTQIDARDLVNFDFSYRPTDGDWSIAAYGRNVTDERYDNARLNTGDYVLIMLSNDASEFGVRFTKEF